MLQVEIALQQLICFRADEDDEATNMAKPTADQKPNAVIATKEKRRRGRPRQDPQVLAYWASTTPTFSFTDESEITFDVLGRPVPKDRTKRGWNGNMYNPSKCAENDFTKAVEDICNKHLGRVPKFSADTLLRVSIEFYYPCKNSEREHSIIKKADIDNLCKFVLDSLSRVLYPDDKQIVVLSAKKLVASDIVHGRIVVSIAAVLMSRANHYINT